MPGTCEVLCACLCIAQPFHGKGLFGRQHVSNKRSTSYEALNFTLWLAIDVKGA